MQLHNASMLSVLIPIVSEILLFLYGITEKSIEEVIWDIQLKRIGKQIHLPRGGGLGARPYTNQAIVLLACLPKMKVTRQCWFNCCDYSH